MRRDCLILRLFRSMVMTPLVILFLVGAVRWDAPASSAGEAVVDHRGAGMVLLEDFQGGFLSPVRWKMTFKNDFNEKTIDVVDAGKRGKNDLRLRLMANTLGTNDETVKFLGVRTVGRIDFPDPKAISFSLDWNGQANGSYLAAGVYLCPTPTDASPGDEPDWIKFEYVGVPPGHNARLQVVRRTKGTLRVLFDEGWPEKQRTGRKITELTVKFIIDPSALELYENGDRIFSTQDHELNFTEAYMHLEMSSHSNYASRTVFFDDVSVRSSPR